jgi:FAD/FMN-containing dehydrogenase
VAEFVALSEASAAEWEYTVAWIDCLATRGDRLRGVLFRGNHVADDRPSPLRAARRWPFTPPLSLVNAASLRAFNALYWQRQRIAARRRVHQPYTQFFYPLDGLLGWNRMYGPRGFYQYQCVLPLPVQEAATAELLGLIAKSGTGSFLGVLKTFGDRPAPRSAGMLSFPMPGITVALDFPNQGPRTLRLFEQLNDVVRRAGGRLYPAKDACMPRDLFERGYPGLAEFRRFRDLGLSSQMSRRLLGD